jgi:ketosteroid isomerase-like protein
MASGRTELVLRGFEALARGDVDELAAQASDDFEFVNPDYALEPGIRHGPAGGRVALQNLSDAFDDLRWDMEQLEERGDRVIVTGTWAGRGKASGVRFAGEPFAVVVTFRDDEVVRLEWFNSADEALTSAGAKADGP